MTQSCGVSVLRTSIEVMWLYDSHHLWPVGQEVKYTRADGVLQTHIVSFETSLEGITVLNGEL